MYCHLKLEQKMTKQNETKELNCYQKQNWRSCFYEKNKYRNTEIFEKEYQNDFFS